MLELIVHPGIPSKEVLLFIAKNKARFRGQQIRIHRVEADGVASADTVAVMRRRGIKKLPALILPGGKVVVGRTKIIGILRGSGPRECAPPENIPLTGDPYEDHVLRMSFSMGSDGRPMPISEGGRTGGPRAPNSDAMDGDDRLTPEQAAVAMDRYRRDRQRRHMPDLCRGGAAAADDGGADAGAGDAIGEGNGGPTDISDNIAPPPQRAPAPANRPPRSAGTAKVEFTDELIDRQLAEYAEYPTATI